MLEEVQMSPCSFGGVVDLASGTAALWAVERGTGREIEVEVELLVVGRELDTVDGPRSCHAQGGGK